MQITDIKIRKFFDEGPMKAIVSVTFDNQLALHDIKVIYAKEKFFVVMPSKKNPDNTYRDIAHPISSDFTARAAIQQAFVPKASSPAEELRKSKKNSVIYN